MELGDFKWTPIKDIKPGDKLSHWGNEDTVISLEQSNGDWFVTLYDELLQKERTHKYRLTDELLVKQPSKAVIQQGNSPRFSDHLSDDELRTEIASLEASLSAYEGASLTAAELIISQFKEVLKQRDA